MSDYLLQYDDMEEGLFETGETFDFDPGWDTEFDEDQASPAIVQFMNNQDYTLNSPLIIDVIEDLRGYLMTGRANTLNYSKSWEDIKRMLAKGQVNIGALLHTNKFHGKCTEFWSKTNIPLLEFRELLHSVDNHAGRTFKVVKDYLKGWINQELNFKSRKDTRETTLIYGAYMLESLILTWLLNASSSYELDQLSKSFKFKYVDNTDAKMGIIYESKIFGRVLIGKGIIHLYEINMIWNRNMMLMFKDTSTARFHTLFNIQHRQMFPYQKDHLDKIIEMYKLGDKVLAYNYIFAYEVFGLIEPIASLNLSKLARNYRPLIPEFPHFTNHVDTQIEDLSHKVHPARRFFNFLKGIMDKDILLTVYGSFRHWGHPFIDYMVGLKALHDNVNSDTLTVNKKSAELLASDLAFKILYNEFSSKHKWYIDLNLMQDSHPLYPHVRDNTWPDINTLTAYPHSWHKLPLLKCWDVPEVVEPSLIYSDKTHSIGKSELVNHLLNHPNQPIPTKKVLKTLMEKPSTNWPKFLQSINDGELEDDAKIIGLKPKEREIKWKGRFFALMSWELREYFVFTEYLIKKNVLPLFSGLTMADDQTALLKKMLKNSTGQGNLKYDNITIANHIDYEKWNNFQRKESTAPVFKVIGQFFGLPNLFMRTHEFFEDSLVYYRDRPDLMKVQDGKVVNRYSNKLVCWQGQKGGLEGLRQKGWSVLNLLVIERASRTTNTEVKILAQGDNQVICTFYKLAETVTEEAISEHLSEIIQNNSDIMSEIRRSTLDIGLKINEDETLQSADMLIYGKVIIYRGNITCLEEKRYSRVTCTTNDQLPSFGNVMSTVATNCLTVAHYSKSPINAMITYNWLGNLAISLLALHNPALRTAPSFVMKKSNMMEDCHYRISLLYLDPSLGGLSGTCLTRFHIRMFPDPVTESLTFWRILAVNTTDTALRRLCIRMGNPRLCRFSITQLNKLLEDPASLNLPKGLSAQNLIKSEIKTALHKNSQHIRHEILKDAISYSASQEPLFVAFLSTIKPCFPRFLSEFRAASYFGLSDSVIGLFQNSKTIRNYFKGKFRDEVDIAILRCELGSLNSLIDFGDSRPIRLWNCSAEHAQFLRETSWSREIVGMTIPHPAEMISKIININRGCKLCDLEVPLSIPIIGIVPYGIQNPDDHRGPYQPYLGSSTSETTSLIQTWEKDTDISFVRKAANMRRAINWFVEPNSNLATILHKNLESLIGSTPGQGSHSGSRSGSALHRFSCSRVSPGGYTANSFTYGSRIIMSTDSFQILGDTNYDFMFQSLLIYSQQTIGEIHNESPDSATYHLHISCKSCLRKITEPLLDTPVHYDFPDRSQNLLKWKPPTVDWMKDIELLDFPEGRWELLTIIDQSDEIGILHGVTFGTLHRSYSDKKQIENLFPISLRSKLVGSGYFRGLRDGLYRAAAIDASHRGLFRYSTLVPLLIRSSYLCLVNQLSRHGDFISFLQTPLLLQELQNVNHRIPSSYPLNQRDLGNLFKSYMSHMTYNDWKTRMEQSRKVWIFSDFSAVSISGVLIIAYELSKSIIKHSGSRLLNEVRSWNDALSSVREDVPTDVIKGLSKHVLYCPSEVRHAMKTLRGVDESENSDLDELQFSNQPIGRTYSTIVHYVTTESEAPDIIAPHLDNPLVSGLRACQLATGTHYKIHSILNELDCNPQGVVCGGDGSGGISALILRLYPQSRVIFNSLMEMTDVQLGGALPEPPSAIQSLGPSCRKRCINLKNSWQGGSNLAHRNTWISMLSFKKSLSLVINLGIFDMQVRDQNEINCIHNLMKIYIPQIFDKNCTIIIKSYINQLVSKDSVLYKIGYLFHKVMLFQTETSGSHTSEVYVVMEHQRTFENFVMYPVWKTCESFLRQAFCFRSYEDEFSRAYHLTHYDFLEGFPEIYIPDSKQEIKSILDSCGLHPLLIEKYFMYYPETNDLITSFIYGSCIVLTEYFINTTAWMGNFNTPSDQKLNAVFGYIIGSFLALALHLNNAELGRNIQSYIDRKFNVDFNRISAVSDDALRTGSAFMMTWSINKNSQHSKSVYLHEKGSLIRATLRYWLLVLKGCSKTNPWNFSIMTTEMNKRLTVKHVQESSGLLHLMTHRNQI